MPVVSWSCQELSEDFSGTPGQDVLTAIRVLKIDKPVLVGHFFAGVESSSVANLDPTRICSLHLPEAAYPYAFDNGEGHSMNAFQEIQGRQAPSPSGSDLRSFTAIQRWDAQVSGFGFRTQSFVRNGILVPTDE